METLPISKFKATCLSVLKDVKEHKKKVLITKRGEPIAEIIPVDEKKEDIPLKETVQFLGDIITPLADEDWEVLK